MVGLLPRRGRMRAPASAAWLLLHLILAPRPVAGAEPALPPPPQWVGAADIRGKAHLTWVRNPAFAKVRVYRRAAGEGGFRPIAETADNVYADAEVAPGGAYAYRLRALSPAGLEGPPSMEIAVRIAQVRLLPPLPPQWEGFLPVEGGVGLRWLEQPGRDVVAYNVYRRLPPAEESVLLGSTRTATFRDEGLERGRVYAYSLGALDSSLRETARSRELEVVLSAPAPERAAPPSWKVRRTRLVALVGEAEGAPLLRPADVVAGPVSGDFYLADSGRRRIFVFSGDGVFLRSVGGAGEGEGAFGNPLGLAADARENLYAVDAAPGVVQVYERAGRPGRRYEVPPPASGRAAGIIDAAVAPDGSLFVVDNRGSRIVALGPGGTPAELGGPGGALGAFSAPAFCAFGPDGELYVADVFNARVQVLGRDGAPRRSFGFYGRGPGGFGRPKGVAVSDSGEVYVADSWLNTVQVFDRDGAFRAVLGDEEGRPLDLGSPNGIALGAGGRTIAIAERLSSRLQIVEVLDAP